MTKKKDKKTIVQSYTRKSTKGKNVKVKSHKRKRRKMGNKITYKTVGQFQVAHDNLGNFRGSKIIPLKTKKFKKIKISNTINKPKSTKRKRIYLTVPNLDTDYYLGKINKTEWKKRRNQLLG